MRGDGPFIVSPFGVAPLFPPHARGWTRPRSSLRTRRAVSPACAGMDRLSASSPSRSARFPRMRGDGPSCQPPGPPLRPFPPHARGWTVGMVIVDECHIVSPACAGMDRSQLRSRLGSRGFPRMRGDGPFYGLLASNTAVFPPHARGWTAHSGQTRSYSSVSPACAGMDPGSPTCDSANRCFPRMRGDGPLPPCATNPTSMFPPHARGWTRRPGRVGAYPGVSPACAGMDPFTMSYRVLLEGFPRMRGDGPSSAALMTVAAKFPPHARGWTQPGLLRLLDGVVSPACAGMDRSTGPYATATGSFPRMRGDGPSGCITRPTRPWFPPHARGWTRAGRHRVGHDSVSPACAGMDRSAAT